MIQSQTTKRYGLSRGFTSMELVIVILVLSVLVGSILIRNPFSISDYSSIAADQLMADIQYVQTRAMGLGSQQRMAFANNSGIYCICNVSTCSVATCSTTGETKTLPGDVLITGTNFGTELVFNSLGEPTFGTGNGTISLSSGNIVIYGITGKVQWSG